MEETLNMLLALLGVAQIVTGGISWYFGMQVKLLRLELMNREECHHRHEMLNTDISKIHSRIAKLEALSEEEHA